MRVQVLAAPFLLLVLFVAVLGTPEVTATAVRTVVRGAATYIFLKIIFLLNNPGKRENLIVKNIPSLNPK